MGRMLIHPEQSLARACSFSLQRILLEAEDHRLSIIRVRALLSFTRFQFHEFENSSRWFRSIHKTGRCALAEP
jgi:hypothetical protein